MNDDAERARVGLCYDCSHVREIQSDRGSRFYFCRRSETDPRYDKYPRLPMKACPGYERGTPDRQQ